MPIGVQFLPGDRDRETQMGGDDRGLQDAIQFLSLRMPRRGPRRGGMAPAALMHGAGGAGAGGQMPDAPWVMALRALAAQGGQPSSPGAAPFGAATPTPRVTPGVLPPGQTPTLPRLHIPLPRTGGIMGYNPADGRFYGTGGPGGIPGGYRRF